MKKYLNSLLFITFFFVWTVSGVCVASEGIATLDSFKGEVHIKSLSSWGTEPEKGLRLYSGDKIFTSEDGTAHIRFHDGSFLDVHHNSVARIVETPPEKESSKTDAILRNIKLFIGKVKYKSSKKTVAKTTLSSPTIVAGIRGSECWFGTDGKESFIDQIEGENDIKGDAIQGAVPEITSKQIKGDPNYQACNKSILHWETYSNEKIYLERMKLAKDHNIFDNTARADRVYSHLLSDKGIMDGYSNLMGKLTGYAESVASEDMTESKTFLGNPDEMVARQAQESQQNVGAAISHIQEISASGKAHQEKLRNLRKLYEEADTHEKKKVISSLIEATLECNSAYEKSALVQALFSEGIVIGIPGFKEDMNDILVISKENFRSVTEFYEKTEIYVNTFLRTKEKNVSTLPWSSMEATLKSDFNMLAARGDKPDPSEFYESMATIGIRVVAGFSGVMNLIVNAFEARLTGSLSYYLNDLVFSALDILDNFRDMFGRVEAGNIENISEIEKDIKKINQKLDRLETSTDIGNKFVDQIQRGSMVLSVKKKKKKKVSDCTPSGPCEMCQNGKLIKLSSGTCDDGDSCTKNDTCKGGKCVGTKIASPTDPNCKGRK